MRLLDRLRPLVSRRPTHHGSVDGTHVPVAPGISGITYDAEHADTLLPALVVEADRIARQIALGAHRQYRPGAGEDFWQYRPAMPNEPVARIDWRQSARGDHLWVREQEAEGNQPVMIWCDSSASMNWHSNAALPTKRSRALLCALAIAGAALRGGERAGVLSGPDAGRPFGGTHALQRIALGLAHTLPDAPAAQWPDVALIRPHGQIVIVSDFLWPLDRVESLLRDIAGRPARAQFLCVLDPAETALPYAGHTRFEGLEGEHPATLPAVETLKPDYQRALRDHLDALRTMARNHHADFGLHVTDRSPLPALLALHTRLSGGIAAGVATSRPDDGTGFLDA